MFIQDLFDLGLFQPGFFLCHEIGLLFVQIFQYWNGPIFRKRVSSWQIFAILVMLNAKRGKVNRNQRKLRTKLEWQI